MSGTNSLRPRCRWRIGVLAVLGMLLLAAPGRAQDAGEIAFWESVRTSNNPEELQSYLGAYPNGKFAVLARIRIKALQGGPQAKPGPLSPPTATQPPPPPPDQNQTTQAEPFSGTWTVQISEIAAYRGGKRIDTLLGHKRFNATNEWTIGFLDGNLVFEGEGEAAQRAAGITPHPRAILDVKYNDHELSFKVLDHEKVVFRTYRIYYIKIVDATHLMGTLRISDEAMDPWDKVAKDVEGTTDFRFEGTRLPEPDVPPPLPNVTPSPSRPAAPAVGPGAPPNGGGQVSGALGVPPPLALPPLPSDGGAAVRERDEARQAFRECQSNCLTRQNGCSKVCRFFDQTAACSRDCDTEQQSCAADCRTEARFDQAR
jgi:hypothetical protein